MTLSQRIGVVEINTLWLFRYLQLAKKRTKVVSFHRLSGTGMTSLIHLSPLLKCLMTVCPSSLHSCVQGVMYNLGTFLEGPRDEGPGPSRTKGYNLGTR